MGGGHSPRIVAGAGFVSLACQPKSGRAGVPRLKRALENEHQHHLFPCALIGRGIVGHLFSNGLLLASGAPADLSAMFPPDTYRVSQLGDEVNLFLSEAFSGVWVGGDVQRPTLSRNGHLYFQLVEKGPGDRILGSLDAVLFRRDRQRVSRFLREAGVELADGQSLRCFGNVDFYSAGGRLQLVVRDVDPMFTLGALEHRRRQTLEALAAADMIERNARLSLAAVPLRIGLVTSRGSAACEDLLATLRSSPYGFQVLLSDAAVQGAGAEAEVSRALRRLSNAVDRGRLELDLLVLVRGGGSRADLATFDSKAIAEAVATAVRPVLTGLGHEIDEAIADRVAFQAFKTPTGVAEFLVQRVAKAEQCVSEIRARVARAARDRLLESRRAAEVARTQLRLSAKSLGTADSLVSHLGQRLVSTVRSRLDGNRRRTDDLARRLRAPLPRRVSEAKILRSDLFTRFRQATRQRLSEAQREVASLSRVAQQLSPDRVLARGFSITRGQDGRAIRSASGVRIGDRVEIELKDGGLGGRVESVS